MILILGFKDKRLQFIQISKNTFNSCSYKIVLNDVTIADACCEWLKLVDCAEITAHQDLAIKRIYSALESSHLLAFMLDSMHKNYLFREKQKGIAHRLLFSFILASL